MARMKKELQRKRLEHNRWLPATSNAIGPGRSTDILVVATNATTYDTLGALGISGGNGASPANGQITGLFEPTFVPEPSTIVLLSLGLAATAAFRKRIS